MEENHKQKKKIINACFIVLHSYNQLQNTVWYHVGSFLIHFQMIHPTEF